MKEYSLPSYLFVLYFLVLFMLSACSESGGESAAEQNNTNYKVSLTSSTPQLVGVESIGAYSIEKTDSYVQFNKFATKGAGYEPGAMYVLYAYLRGGFPLLKSPPVLNDRWNGEDGFTYPGWRYSSTVSGLSETVSAGSQIFTNCLKITTTITGDGVFNGTPVSQEQNAFVRGVRDIWFAPGVGVVKMQYKHENGFTTTAELISSTLVNNDSSDYFPLAIGNQWTYQWINEYRSSFVTDVYTVTSTCVGECDIKPIN